ncbi:MAG: hypothetical protein Q9168_007157 [Polycauliona sp. 1 TL-2023]
MEGIPEPIYDFLIPSIHGDTSLACRIYGVHGELSTIPRSPKTAKAPRTPGANKSTKLPPPLPTLKGAVVAHNHPRFGGSYDNDVVLKVVKRLVEEDIIFTQYPVTLDTIIVRHLSINSGVGKSGGKTTWTGKAELQDHISFLGFFVHYLSSLYEQTAGVIPHEESSGSKPKTPDLATTEPSIQLIIIGYSYGALMTRHLPDIPTMMRRFSNVTLRSTEADIYSRASRLASITTMDLISSKDMQSMENYTAGDREMLEDKAKEYMAELKKPFIREAVEAKNPLPDPGPGSPPSPPSSEGETATLETTLPTETIYILISMLLGPAATLATGFKSLAADKHELKTLDKKFQLNPMWLIHGGADCITRRWTLLEWHASIRKGSNVQCQRLRDPDAGHHWNGKGMKEKLGELLGEILVKCAGKQREPVAGGLLKTITEASERQDSGGGGVVVGGKHKDEAGERYVVYILWIRLFGLGNGLQFISEEAATRDRKENEKLGTARVDKGKGKAV